jgi:hypothetical protein
MTESTPSSGADSGSVPDSGVVPRRSVLAAAGLLPLAAGPGGLADVTATPSAAPAASVPPPSTSATPAAAPSVTAARRPPAGAHCKPVLPRHGPARGFAGRSTSIAYVPFEDVAPPYLTLTESWNALGTDDQDRVYIVWTSTRDDGRGDSALFRYTHSTRKREFLGSFIDVATRQGNIRPGEEIPKGHTRIVQVGRKLYLGSQGFHDFKEGIEDLPNYRGAHLFTYDLDTGAFDDVSRTLPGGVVIPHQGIVALNYSPEHHLLVGLAHPLGDIVLYDLRTQRVRKVVPGSPWALNHVVSREIVVTRTGKVYTYRGPEDPELRDVVDEVWEYDIATDRMRTTGQFLRGGFWNGQAVTRNRSTIYLSTVSGELYRLDVASGRFSHLGHFTDPADHDDPAQYRVMYLYGIGLTAAEDRLIGLPIIAPTAADGDSATRLTTYRIARGRFTKHQDTDIQVFTGSNHRDRAGHLYQAAFDWDHNCHLAVITPG